MRRVTVVAVFAALLGACGDSGSSSVDARPEFKCWPSIDPIARGTVELGKGGTAFSPMPEALNLEYGFQGGFMVKVWPRITGIDAGVPDTTVDFANPATRVRAAFVDSDAALQVAGDCGERGSYAPNAVGSFDYYEELAVIFDMCWGDDRLVGTKIKLTAEVMDASGNYATDSRIITMAESLDPAFHNIPSAPGCGED